jgi:hypothetical protein
MNNAFSFSRLWLLIKKQWFDNVKLYMLSILAVFGLMAIVFFIWTWTSGPNYDEVETYVIFFVGLFITGLIFASITFGALGDRPKGIYWLSVPATHLEKLICGIFYSTILFTTFYFACFYIIQPITLIVLEMKPGYSVKRIPHWNEGMKAAMYVFFALQALFLLGSVYFEKYSFIKTALAGLVFFLLFGLYVNFMQRNLIPHNAGMRGLASFAVYETKQVKIYKLDQWVEDTWLFLLKYIWVPVFWVAAYFRLREKEI